MSGYASYKIIFQEPSGKEHILGTTRDYFYFHLAECKEEEKQHILVKKYFDEPRIFKEDLANLLGLDPKKKYSLVSVVDRACSYVQAHNLFNEETNEIRYNAALKKVLKTNNEYETYHSFSTHIRQCIKGGDNLFTPYRKEEEEKLESEDDSVKQE